MEAIGLVVGIAGLFSTWLEAAERIQAYRSFSADSYVLETRFQAVKVLFEQWGRRVGFEKAGLSEKHDPELDKPEISSAVTNVLQIIQTICDSGNPYRPTLSPIENVPRGAVETPPRRGERRQKLKWAFSGKQKRTDQIELLEILVQQLHNLVSPEASNTFASLTTSTHTSIAEIQRVLTRMEQEARAEIRKEVFCWIGHGSTNQHYHDSIQNKLAGTCDWIYQRSVFQSWLSPGPANCPILLWINGPAGFGKTILSASIVDHLLAALSTPVAHFFFSSELENRDDPFLAIRSWISQLISHHETAFECARLMWEGDSDTISSRKTSIALFTQIVSIVPSCTFVADGLDECTHLDNHKVSVANFLSVIIDAISATSSRILIVSRDEPRIRYAIMSATPESFAEYTISPEDVRSDTASVSREIIDRKLPKKSNDARKLLSEAMTSRCEGQFLWLKMQEESLRKGMNMKQLQQVVEGAPARLDAVYDREWSRMTKSPACERIFILMRWAAFALRPLTVCEITEAALIDDSDDLPMEDLPDDVDDDYIESEIVGLCAPLIQIRDSHSDKMVEGRSESFAYRQTVHLAHFSVKQFLLMNLPVPGRILVNEALRSEYHNTLLTKACIQYMNFHRVWQDTTDHPSSLGMAFRNYAAGLWHRHLRSGISTDEEVSDLVTQLLDKQNWVWDKWRSWYDERQSGFHHNPDYDIDPTAAKKNFRPWPGPIPGPLYYAVRLGMDDVVLELIRDGNFNSWDNEYSAVQVSGETGREHMLKILVDPGTNVQDITLGGWSLLHFATNAGSLEATKFLLGRGADVARTTNGFTVTALHHTRNVGAPKALIDKGASMTDRNKNGFTPLHIASLYGRTDIVQLFLDVGANVDAGDEENGATPLRFACMKGHVETAKLLIDQGARLIGRDCRGMTPLHYACCEGHTKIAELCIEAGADILDKDVDGNSSLHLACTKGHTELVRLLIDKGANIEQRDKHGYEPLHRACANGHPEVVKLLIAAGCDVTYLAYPHANTFLHDAAMEGFVEIAKILVDNGASITALAADGMMPLHTAATFGRTDVAKLLLDGGASMMAATTDGWMPLHLASYHSHLEICRLLIANGADIMSQGPDGHTPLHLASRIENTEVAETLLENGASVSAITMRQEKTPLHFASGQGTVETVKLLLRNGATIDQASKQGVVPLDLAAQCGRAEVFEFLMQTSPKRTVNEAEVHTGLTLLHRASLGGNEAVVKILLEAPDLDPSRTDYLGCTPLLLACRQGYEGVARMLIADGRIDPNARNWHGSTALFAAVRNGRLGITEQLLKLKGVSVEGQDGFGRSLFWWARQTNNLQIIQLLERYLNRTDKPSHDDRVEIEPFIKPNVNPKSPQLNPEGYCDACLLSGLEYRRCSTCVDKYFCLCLDCFETVSFQCCDGKHTISQS